MKRVSILVITMLLLGLALCPPAMAQARDIDFDWIASMLDKLLAGYCPGITIQLTGADNDLNGIWDEDTLAQLAIVLRGGTCVGTTVISAANVAQIQADFATNRNLVYNDLMIYGEYNLPLGLGNNVARQYIQGSYGSDKLCEILKAELGPVGGDLTSGLLLDYFAGLVTVGETADGNTFTAINNYIGQIVDGLCAGMGNTTLYVTNMWAVLRQEKTARALQLTQASYTATRWGSGGSHTNLFGKNGIFNASGTPAGTTTNINRYTLAAIGYTGTLPNTWRENFLGIFGVTQIPLRISTPPHGTPSVNYANQGNMTSGPPDGNPTQWTMGTNWAVNNQDDVAAPASPTSQFKVMKHTSGNTAELTQTQAQQPASAKIATGVTYRINFQYKSLGTAVLTAGVSVGLGTATSSMFATDNNDWHTETAYVTATGPTPSIRFVPNTGWTGYVDNVFIFVASLAGDPLNTGAIVTAGGTGAVSDVWEDAQDFPPSNSMNILNNNSFKGNSNNWDVGTWTYVDKGGSLTLMPFQRMEKTGADTTALTQTLANMKTDKPLRPSTYYTVSYFLYQTAGSITPNLSGTPLATRSFVNSGEVGQICTETVLSGPSTNPQQITFVPTATFRGRIYWVYIASYANYQLDPYWSGDPPGSHRQDFVADGVTGNPNDNGYRGVVPATWNLQYNYLLPWHDGMAPWVRVSDTPNSPSYTSSLVYNPPDFAATVPTGSVAGEALGGRTSPLAFVYVGARAFAISTQPTSVTINAGSPFSLVSGAVGGDSVPVYQWYKGLPGDTSTPVGTPFSNTYGVGNATPADGGTYFMRATNLLGFLDSNAATVTVIAGGGVYFTLQPLGGNKAVGGSHTFNVTAAGNVATLTYSLYRNGLLVTSNGTGSFPLNPLVAGDHGNYYVHATDGSTSADSNIVTLNVLSILTNPTPQTVTSGADVVTLSVVAQNGTGGFTYQWYLDGVQVNNAGGHISGATTATLQLDNVQVLDGTYTGHPGVYTCVVRDSSSATVTSGGAALTVNAAVLNVSGPGNTSVYFSQSATFIVSPSGGSSTGFAFTYTWYQQGNATPLVNGAKYDLTSPATLRVLNVNSADNGTVYYCTVGETPGVRPPVSPVTSATATLTATLAAINISPQPSPAQKYVGDSQAFSIAATGGVGTLTYQWQKGGIDLVNAAGHIAGATTPDLSLTNLVTLDAGSYVCLVGDDARPSQQPRAASTAAALQVAARIGLSALTTPLNRKAGDTYSFNVIATGGYGTLHYQWKKDSVNVGGDSATLDLGTLSYAKQGFYTCTVTDTYTDSKDTNAAYLTVLEILTQPSGGNYNPGGSHTFTVVVTSGSGVPGYTYQWKKNGSATGQPTTSSFTISPLAVSDDGTYTCDVRDSASVVLTSADAVLVVNNNPIIIDTQPLPDAKYVTQSKTFTIAAHGGVGTLTYQWQKQSGPTTWDNVGSGATTYTINPLALGDAGTYRCQITDTSLPIQTATSDAVLLEVTLAEILASTTPGDQKFTGEAHTFLLNASGGVGTLTYKWQKGGIDLVNAAGHIAGVTTDTLELTNLVTGDDGTYVCLVGDDARPPAPLVPSNSAVLEVRKPVSIALPGVVGGNKKVGDSHTFTVIAEDGYTPYAYQWYRDATFVGSDSTLTLDPLTAVDQGNYTCQVNGNIGAGVTSEDMLTVLAIQTQPEPQSTTARGSATFGVTVMPDSGVPSYTYQWKYKGANIPLATNATLTLNNCQGGAPDGNPAPVNPAGNEGSYSCVVTDAASVVLESGAVPLTVNSNALNITAPVSGREHVGHSFGFSVTVTEGYGPAYTYQWQKQNGPSWDNVGSGTSTYTINPLATTDAGTYRCLVGEVGVRTGVPPLLDLSPSTSAALEIADAVSITGQPDGADLYAGETFTATVAATGGFVATAYHYQWFKNTVLMPSETSATLTFVTPAGVASTDSYTCKATDDDGSNATSNPAALTVVKHVSITTHPASGMMELNTPYPMSVEASGGKGELNYTWYRNDEQHQVGTGPSYVITLPSMSNTGTYWCVVSDSGTPTPDSARSNSAMLTVNLVFGFITEPQSARLYKLDEYTLEAQTEFGIGNLTYTFHTDAPYPAYVAAGGVVPQDGSDMAYTRTLVPLALTKAGSYYVTVVDDMGTEDTADDKTLTSATAVIQVKEHLAIGLQPTSGTGNAGASHTFTVAAGAGNYYTDLTYEWRKQPSSTVIGTNASLTLSPLIPENAGLYNATIHDSYLDAVESNTAELTVIGGALPATTVAGLGLVLMGIALGATRMLRRKQ